MIFCIRFWLKVLLENAHKHYNLMYLTRRILFIFIFLVLLLKTHRAYYQVLKILYGPLCTSWILRFGQPKSCFLRAPGRRVITPRANFRLILSPGHDFHPLWKSRSRIYFFFPRAPSPYRVSPCHDYFHSGPASLADITLFQGKGEKTVPSVNEPHAVERSCVLLH